MKEMVIQKGGAHLVLLPERGVYIQTLQALVVADLHLGKASAFKAQGMALPDKNDENDLIRLSGAIDKTRPKHIYFLGDLVHSHHGYANTSRIRFAEWREKYFSLDMTLITGNHDAKAGKLPKEWRLNQQKTLILPPFILCHEPGNYAPHETLAGHIHPKIAIGKGMRQRVVAPCFWSQQGGLVLPAFSSFVDGVLIHPKPSDKIYPIAGDEVLEI